MKSLKDFTDFKNEIEQISKELDEYFFEIENVISESSVFREKIKTFIQNLNSNFTVAVVGVIKRGKSTFLNALMEAHEAILSTDVTPETAKLSFLKFAEEPYAFIKFNDNTSKIISLNELPKYTNTCSNEFYSDKKGEKDKLEKTKYAEIYLNNKYLFNSIDLVDTPGVDDPDVQRSQVTEEFIAKADAVIFLIDAVEGGLKESEMNFLQSRIVNSKNQKGILLVCNKILGLRKRQEEQLPELIDETKRILEPILGGNITIYPIDAKAAFEGNKEGDLEKLKKSRFKEFTIALERFLIEDKGKVLLKKRIADLNHEIIIPIKEKLSFKLKLEPDNLQIYENEIKCFENEIFVQSDFISKLKYDLNKEAELIGNWVQNEINNHFKNCQFSESNINNIQNILSNIVITIEDKTKRKVENSLIKYINKLESQNIEVQNIKFKVQNLDITKKDFYITKTVEEKRITHDDKIKNAIKGAVAGSWLTMFIPFAPIVTAAIAYLATEDKTESINKDLIIFNEKKFNEVIMNYKNELINNFSKDCKLIFKTFMNEINKWEDNKKSILNFNKKAIESKRNISIEQHINEQKKLNEHLKIIESHLSKINLINNKIEGL